MCTLKVFDTLLPRKVAYTNWFQRRGHPLIQLRGKHGDLNRPFQLQLHASSTIDIYFGRLAAYFSFTSFEALVLRVLKLS